MLPTCLPTRALEDSRYRGTHTHPVLLSKLAAYMRCNAVSVCALHWRTLEGVTLGYADGVPYMFQQAGSCTWYCILSEALGKTQEAFPKPEFCGVHLHDMQWYCLREVI